MNALMPSHPRARLAALALLACTLAACELGKKTETTGALAQCHPVAAACARNEDCCSYGCLSGTCSPNPNEGGACKTSDDCMLGLCKSGGCRSLATCRDDADACSYDDQCCSGNCVGASYLSDGQCQLNHAPVVDLGADREIPYHQPYQIPATVSDPDGDELVHGWTLVPPVGSAAVLSSQTDPSASFTPDVAGRYLVTLTVTDGSSTQPARITVQKTVALTAGNTVPVVDAGQPVEPASRNNPVSLSGTATDPDGDALSCTWKTTAPGAVSTAVIAGPAPCAGLTTASYTPGAEGTWTATLEVSDGVHTATASTTVQCGNDPPTPAASRSPYYANMGATAGTTPAVSLDASPSTDRNGDALGFAWAWKSFPAGPPTLSATNTAQTSFTPGQAGTYVLTVTVTDPAWTLAPTRAGASTSADVTVEVGRYVQPLTHDVADAAYAKTADKLILAGHDPADATKGMIWVYDPATGTEGSGIQLDSGGASGIPRLLAVTPDASKAVIVDGSVSIWIVSLGATPSMSRVTQPFAVGDLVVAGGRYAYLFENTGDASVQELDLSDGSFAPVFSGYGGFGAAYSGASNTLYRVDTWFNYWDKYSVGANGAGSSSGYSGSQPSCGGYPVQYATQIWASLDNQYVFSSCGGVYNASTLASLGPTSLGLSPVHVDSASSGAVLAADGDGTLHRFNGTLQSAGIDAMPRWAQDGFSRTLYVKKAFFVNAAATKWLAVVSDSASPARHGVVTFP